MVYPSDRPQCPTPLLRGSGTARPAFVTQAAQNGETLWTDPRNHCEFMGLGASQILDSEDASVSQSPGASERQPRLCHALEARQYSSNEDGLDLLDKCAPVSRLWRFSDL